MIKNNKVINSVLLPKVLSLTAIISFALSASIYVAQDSAPETAHISKKDMYLLGFVALLMFCAGADVYSDYKKNNNFSSLIARKYLKKELEEHPELKLFKKVLDNPQALQEVSTLIFNSLRPSERKLVAQIILKADQNLRDHRKYGTEDTEYLKTAKILLKDARDKIITIIQGHASVHPEFISDIYSVMARADMIYIMPKDLIQQHTK